MSATLQPKLDIDSDKYATKTIQAGSIIKRHDQSTAGCARQAWLTCMPVSKDMQRATGTASLPDEEALVMK